MVNYGKGKIYRIINTENETIYIGSTCQNLAKRLSSHKHRGNGNKIILIENYDCNCREELVMREQQVIEEYNNLANQYRAYRSPEQHKKIIKKYRKEYEEANKEKIKEKKKEYREANKEHIAEYHKEYYEANKDKLKEYKKEYYEANKDKLKEYYDANNAKRGEKVQCEFCNSLVRKDGLKTHQKRDKCKKYQ